MIVISQCDYNNNAMGHANENTYISVTILVQRDVMHYIKTMPTVVCQKLACEINIRVKKKTSSLQKPK